MDSLVRSKFREKVLKKRRREEEEAQDDDEEDESVAGWHVNPTVAKRIKVCALMDAAGYGTTEACRLVGCSRKTFYENKWYEKYEEGGFGVLFDDQRHGVTKQMTPNTRRVVGAAARAGANAPDIIQKVVEKRKSEGDKRAAPTRQYVSRIVAELGGTYTHQFIGGAFMVRTPWHARWRLQFARHWLVHMRAYAHFVKSIIFSDEKKFCLWASAHGRYTFSGDEYNVSHALKMNDEEYRAWKKDHKILPHSKARGLFAVFVWGAVGYNIKTDLFFLDKGETLTKETYLEVLEENLISKLPEIYAANAAATDRRNTRGIQLYLAQDNDPKHYNPASQALLEKHKIKIWGAKRSTTDGTHPDRTPGPGGHLQDQIEEKFPAYSPDINAPIEKTWREAQRRTLDP